MAYPKNPPLMPHILRQDHPGLKEVAEGLWEDAGFWFWGSPAGAQAWLVGPYRGRSAAVRALTKFTLKLAEGPAYRAWRL